MGVQHIPAHGGDWKEVKGTFEGQLPVGDIQESDDYPYVIAPGAFTDGQEAPVTLWIDGKKHPVGKAVVQGDKIMITLDDNISPATMDIVAGRSEPMMYSIDPSGEVAVLFGNALDQASEDD